jgi:hypothetical protein
LALRAGAAKATGSDLVLTYRLVEIEGGRPLYVEEFDAPDDAEALARVHDVVVTDEFEVWRDGAIIEHHRPSQAISARG